MLNCYGTLDDLKNRLGITSTTDDALLLSYLESASRIIDNHCHRHFYIESATRYFDGTDADHLWIDDFLSISALTTDTDYDGVWDDETWVEGTDWCSWPYNGYPKRKIMLLPDGNYCFSPTQRLIQAVGVWGYGNGSATPQVEIAVTGTVATSTGTALTLSVSAGVQAGQTILIESEQMFVSAVSTTTATVERGVNGTTAAAHTSKGISVYRYPSPLVRLAQYLAIETYRTEPLAGFISENIGGYSYSRVSKITDTMQTTIDRVTSGYVRTVRH